MKGNTKRVKAAEPAPVDSIDLIDRTEFEKAMSGLWESSWADRRMIEEKIEKIKDETKMFAIVGGVVTAALCFVIAMRRES